MLISRDANLYKATTPVDACKSATEIFWDHCYPSISRLLANQAGGLLSYLDGCQDGHILYLLQILLYTGCVSMKHIF